MFVMKINNKDSIFILLLEEHKATLDTSMRTWYAFRET